MQDKVFTRKEITSKSWHYLSMRILSERYGNRYVCDCKWCQGPEVISAANLKEVK